MPPSSPRPPCSGPRPRQHPLADLAACPERVAHPGYVCRPNGCGAAPMAIGKDQIMALAQAPSAHGAGGLRRPHIAYS
ncbi:hypothetical protein PO883_27035 [Massilia sp. DJPM01]|uniref:hypothetical protein n=1 Tax=Massilia sp. DJPM01 TaxID=3024404 RepID=UPI00259F2B9D|nr:hypothetical protein [Massilia sp. DJPM01]MDM5180842.1 hypothetical protein [Massilia sp. DJPM01]